MDGVNFKVRLVGPHSNHFSTLYFDNDMLVESSEIVEECEDTEQKSYILKFAPEKQHKSIPHFKAEWFTMHHSLLSFFIFIAPLYERSKKMDARLRVKFISSRLRKKLMWVMP